MQYAICNTHSDRGLRGSSESLVHHLHSLCHLFVEQVHCSDGYVWSVPLHMSLSRTTRETISSSHHSDELWVQSNVIIRVLQWPTTSYHTYSACIRTSSVTFSQTALASLNRGSRTCIACVITRAPPLLSAAPTRDCALSPLWPWRPAVLTVHC